MAEVKIAADSGGGTVALKGPASTTGNAAVSLKLPVADGSANQHLKTDGSGNLGWATDTNDLVKITTIRDGGNVGGLTHNIDTSTYRAYNIIGAFEPVTDSAYLYFYWRASSADITASSYEYSANYVYPNDNHYVESASGQAKMEVLQNAGNSDREGWRLNLWMFPNVSGDAGPDISNFCTWDGMRVDASSDFRGVQGCGNYDAAANPDGFTIKPSTGNFASYTYSLYGLKA